MNVKTKQSKTKKPQQNNALLIAYKNIFDQQK